MPLDLDEVTGEEKLLLQQLSKGDYDEEYLLKKVSMLQLHLDEAQKIIQAERRYALLDVQECTYYIIRYYSNNKFSYQLIQ